MTGINKGNNARSTSSRAPWLMVLIFKSLFPGESNQFFFASSIRDAPWPSSLVPSEIRHGLLCLFGEMLKRQSHRLLLYGQPHNARLTSRTKSQLIHIYRKGPARFRWRKICHTHPNRRRAFRRGNWTCFSTVVIQIYFFSSLGILFRRGGSCTRIYYCRRCGRRSIHLVFISTSICISRWWSG